MNRTPDLLITNEQVPAFGRSIPVPGTALPYDSGAVSAKVPTKMPTKKKVTPFGRGQSGADAAAGSTQPAPLLCDLALAHYR